MQCHRTTLLALELTQAHIVHLFFVLFLPLPQLYFLCRKEMCDNPVGTTRWITSQDRIVSKKLMYRGPRKSIVSYVVGIPSRGLRPRSHKKRALLSTTLNSIGWSDWLMWSTPSLSLEWLCLSRSHLWVSWICLKIIRNW